MRELQYVMCHCGPPSLDSLRCVAHLDEKAPFTPLPDPVVETHCLKTVRIQRLHGLHGEHAIRPPAVSDYLSVCGQLLQMGLELLQGDGYGAGYVSGTVLVPGPHVEDGGDPLSDTLEEGAAVYGFHPGASFEKAPRDLLDLRQPVLGEPSKASEEHADRLVGYAVDHEAPLFLGLHQTGRAQNTQVPRGVRHAQGGLFRQHLDGLGGLAQQIEQLQALWTACRPAYTGELREDGVFKVSVLVRH